VAEYRMGQSGFVVKIDDGGGMVEFAADLTKSAIGAQFRATGGLRMYGMLLQTTVKANASHPRSQEELKPRIQTGDYVRRITLAFSPTSAMVSTNEPQGRRLELGFTGQDSIGRHYDQPPYPHFGPGLDDIGPLYLAAMAAIA